ncbi:hypothetical protein Tco_0077472 [Tanacetum coccineum]
MRASHILRGDYKNCISRSLPWRETFGGEGDHGCLTKTSLTSALVLSKALPRRVSVYNWEKIPFKLEGEAIEPEGRPRPEGDPRTKLRREKIGEAELALAFVSGGDVACRHSPANPGMEEPSWALAIDHKSEEVF